MKYDYDPFGKDFDSIEVADLQILSTVAEGWYVEYKREVPNSGSIAKSVTAFANTYGGWIFYGIEERSKDDPVAGLIPGILSSEADGCLQRIRQAVANHAQPSPYFRVKALFGPLESMGLPEGRCVIVGHVPWGPEAPYVHKDARIYRRVGDGSEPKPEGDRFILDQLWKRSEQITQGYAEWIDRDVETSEAEKGVPFVRLFLVADFWGDHRPMTVVPIRRIREIFYDKDGNYALPFDNVYQAAGGFVCRQVLNNDPEQIGLTWKLSSRFDSEIIIPLVKRTANSPMDLMPWLDGYDHAMRFVGLCQTQRYDRPTVIDLNSLLVILLGLAQIHVRLAKEFGWSGPVYVKTQISGVWRTIPFFDVSHVLDEYEEHGIALSLSDTLFLHRGEGQSSFIKLPQAEADGEEHAHRVQTAIQFFIPIAMALGVALGVDVEGDGSDLGPAITSFLEAGLRAIEVQKSRMPSVDEE